MSLKLNERYPLRFNNPTADYPQGSFKNRSAPGAKDGSYLEKDWANDKEGFFQSLLASAGIAPNGLVDKVGSSQYFSSIMKILKVSNYAVASGPVNAYTATYASEIAALTDGMILRFRAPSTNTGSATFNPNGLGALPIVALGGGALSAGAITAGGQVWVQYDTSIGGGSWVSVLSIPTLDRFNAAGVTLASSTTVDVLNGAPDTSQITISGTANIVAFRVSPGRSFVIKFSGACTLLNSAQLVTGTGSNIRCAAGDSCLVRSTATNVVEVLEYASVDLVARRVQSSSSDVTDGSILLNGAHGLGVRLVSVDVNLNNYLTPGFYVTPASSSLLNTPPGLPSTGRCTITVSGGSTYTGQLLTSISPAGGFVASRSYDGSTYSPWIVFSGLDSPAFTGAPSAPTATTGVATSQIATTLFVQNRSNADKVSPVFTGNPRAPTAGLSTDSDTIATTAFVQALSLGAKQTWQNVTASRAWATTYTNSTGGPIAVSIVSQDGGGNLDLRIEVSGVTVYRNFFGAGVTDCGIVIVPPGATYRAIRQDTNDTIISWAELRP